MIKNIAIIGAGQMGVGIAQVCALANYQVQVVDVSEVQLLQAQSSVAKNLERLIAKGTLDPIAKEKALKNIAFSQKIQNLQSIDLVIEAIIESLKLKIQLLKSLDQLLPDATIVASNTSSLSITDLANATKRPDRVIGVHFMNPAPLMPLVEVIRGDHTSDSTYRIVEDMVASLRKTVVHSKDSPGFIVNRILMPMINEAIYVVHDGIAIPKDVDTAMRLGTNQPMGPLELADFIGLDTCLSIMRVLHQGLKSDKYQPCPLLVHYVTIGRLGKKVGQGFYEYIPLSDDFPGFWPPI